MSVASYGQGTASADVVMAYSYPHRYLMQGSPVLPVLQPYITANYANGVLSINVENPPTTPPTSATLTVGNATEVIPISNNTGSLTLGVHPSVSGYSFSAQVSAAGCVSWTGDIGAPGQVAPVGLQVTTPTGSPNPSICPVGPGSISFLQEFYAPDIYEALAGLNMLAPAINYLMGVVVPALIAAGTLTSNSALVAYQNFAKQLVPLANLTDGSGNPYAPLSDATTLAPVVSQKLEAYVQDRLNIPGLE
ncbi:MAG: hypothetical protein KGL39_30085, partial [Patescibacteria group bacterium]|nr:hypothetical protein [Patescibacteria group bacterium]